MIHQPKKTKNGGVIANFHWLGDLDFWIFGFSPFFSLIHKLFFFVCITCWHFDWKTWFLGWLLCIERISFLERNKNLNKDEIFLIISHGKKCYRISGHNKYQLRRHSPTGKKSWMGASFFSACFSFCASHVWLNVCQFLLFNLPLCLFFLLVFEFIKTLSKDGREGRKERYVLG